MRNKSKRAYESANRLFRWSNRWKNTLNEIEGFAWAFGGFIALFLVGVAIYGTADNSALAWKNFMQVFPTIGVLLSPAAAIRLVRLGVRGVIELKYRKGATYAQHKQKVDYVTKKYTQAIDKIIQMSKSKDMSGKAAIVQELKKVDAEIKLTDAQQAEIEDKLMMHVQQATKNLPDAERKYLAKVFSDFSK